MNNLQRKNEEWSRLCSLKMARKLLVDGHHEAAKSYIDNAKIKSLVDSGNINEAINLVDEQILSIRV